MLGAGRLRVLFCTGFSAAFGADLETGLVEVARDDRLGGIVCTGTGKKL